MSSGVLTDPLSSPLRSALSSAFAVRRGGGAPALVYEEFDTNFWASAIQDPAGFVVSGVDANSVAVPFALPPRTMPTPRFECSFVPFYGQSLSVGGSGFPALSTENSTTDEMWVLGMRPEDDIPAGNPTTWYASVIPAKEAISPRYATQGETPARGFADAFRGLVTDYYGVSVLPQIEKFMLSAPGQGGIEIIKLLKGDVSGYYARIIAQMEALATLKSGIETVGMEVLPFIHGERDYLLATTKAAYKSRLVTLCADIDADAKTEFGQTSDVQVIGTQVASHIANANQVEAQIALAQAECDDEISNFHLACPMYFLPFKGTDVHLSALGYVWLGAYIAQAHKVVNVDRTALTIVKPTGYSTSGSTCEITYSLPTVDGMTNTLVWDTETVPAQTNYGFRLFDSSDVQQTISSVSITASNRVTITAAATITAGSYIDYARQGDTVKGQGNLRDSAGNVIRAQVLNHDLPLHNWALISKSGALL
jgi:hypothetical protein